MSGVGKRVVLATVGMAMAAADRAEALQKAFNATIKDKAFVADATKQKLEIQLVTGEETLTILKKLYKTPPAIVARAKAAMK